MSTLPRIAAALIAAQLVSSPAAHAIFTDQTTAAGLYGIQPSWGAQAVDMDRDGDVDLLKAHHYFTAYLFTNDGSGSFIINGIPQLITGLGDRHGYLWADLNGDQLIDVDPAPVVLWLEEADGIRRTVRVRLFYRSVHDSFFRTW